MKLKRTLILLFGCVWLSGCAGLFLAGAAGSFIVYDSRSLSTVEADARIYYLVNKSIVRDSELRDARISVTSFNRNVLLTGQVPKASQRVIAEKIAQRVANVRRVYDEIVVGPPAAYTQRSRDIWITGEVRSKMLAKKGLESGFIRIVTEDSVVFLMGNVTKSQASLAVDVARQVSGVNKVVKIFQYIH